MTGSSPGRQRSMFSGEPSDEPKNRLEVLKEKPSRDGAGVRAASRFSGTVLRLVLRLGFERQRHIELRQRRRAQCGLQLGIERRALDGRRRLGGLGALDRCIRCRGVLGRRRALGRACGFRRRRRHDEAIAFQRAIDLGKIGGVITRRRRDERIARHGSRDVDALIVEAGQPIGRGLRRGGSDRTAERERCDLDGAGRGEHPLLPALGDAGLARQQRSNILISDLGRHQSEDAKTEAEGREPRALRLATQHKHCTLTQRLHDRTSVHPCNSTFFVGIEFRLPGS